MAIDVFTVGSGAEAFSLGEEIILSSIRVRLEYKYAVIDKISGFPGVQPIGDPLNDITLTLRFKDDYNRSPGTYAMFTRLRTIADSKTPRSVNIAGIPLGDCVIRTIEFSIIDINRNGLPTGMEVTLDLLQVS